MKRSEMSSKASCTRSLSEPWRPEKTEAEWNPSPFRAALWLAGAHIGGNRDHVRYVQLLDHRLHQSHRDAGARAGFHVIELAHDIGGRPPRNRRQIADSSQRLPMTDDTGDGLAVAAGGYQALALCDAADRDVIDETRTRIAAARTTLVLREHDNALSNRLGAAFGRGKAHRARPDITLWNVVDLGHLGPNVGLQRREVLT